MGKQAVTSATLKTIPLMRSLANDVVFDVMMYLTPEFCLETLEFVTKHINDDLKKLMDIYPDFDPLSKEIGNDCRCSIIGHSLGSVIVWDILSTLKIDMEKAKDTKSGDTSYNPMEMFNLPLTCFNMPTIPNVTNGKENDNATKANAEDLPLWGPILPSALKQKLMFIPEFVLFLGSPIGLFLSLRGASNSFSKYSTLSADDNDGFVSSFALPVSNAMYNIFHPSDPVAYRIEPLLLPPGYEPNLIPSPCFLTTEQGGLTLHTRFTQLGSTMQKTFYAPIGNNNNQSPETDKDIMKRQGSSTVPLSEFKFALGGDKNMNARVDYQLQQGLVGNDYLSSLVAHTSYFRNVDVISFIIELHCAVNTCTTLTIAAPDA